MMNLRRDFNLNSLGSELGTVTVGVTSSKLSSNQNMI